MELAALPRLAPPTRARLAGRWVRERLTTTPGKLLLIGLLVIGGAVGFGVVATAAERSRARAAQAVRTQTEPLLVQAVSLYTYLSDANATATSTFLKGGLEPAALRARYLGDLRVATDSLGTLTREVGGSPAARAAVGVVAEQLPVYSGLVETARAENRQNFPVGAAYLRRAAALLTGTIVQQADRLYTIEAARLRGDYVSGTSSAASIVLFVSVGAALTLLILAQLHLARISRRTFNVPAALATIVLAAVSIWSIVGLLAEQSSLTSAQRNGSDPVEILSATAVLASRAQSDQNLTLVNRGTDEADPLDLLRVMGKLAPPGGLVGEVQALARRTDTTGAADQLASDFTAYRTETNYLTGLENQGLMVTAIDHFSPTAANRLNGDLEAQMKAAQARFERAAADATSSLSGLSIAVPLFTLLAATLALLGLRQRLDEYR